MNNSMRVVIYCLGHRFLELDLILLEQRIDSKLENIPIESWCEQIGVYLVFQIDLIFF